MKPKTQPSLAFRMDSRCMYILEEYDLKYIMRKIRMALQIAGLAKSNFT